MTPPPVCAWLAQQPKEVIAELPLPVPERLWGHETEYQLMSIYHWQQLAHGLLGNAPNDYIRFLNHMRNYDDSLNALRVSVRWIVIKPFEHKPGCTPGRSDQVGRPPPAQYLCRSLGRATVLELLPTSL